MTEPGLRAGAVLHSLGAVIEKEWPPLSLSLICRTTNSEWSADLSKPRSEQVRKTEWDKAMKGMRIFKSIL